MTSLKNLYDKLYSDAICIVGNDSIDTIRVAATGCECFLTEYRDHTYNESYDYAYYMMVNHYNKIRIN